MAKKVAKKKTAKKNAAKLLLANVPEPIDGVTMNRAYTLKEDSSDISIGVFFGEGTPTVDMSISLDDDTIVENHTSNFNKKKIGTNESVKGKNLLITARVTDTSTNTNKTTVLLSVWGGVIDIDYQLQFEVSEHGETITYNLKLRFRR